MNSTYPSNLASNFASDLVGRLRADMKAFRLLCEDVLSLMTRESIALTGSAPYVPTDFSGRRKDLLPHLEKALTRLRSQRALWQQSDPDGRDRDDDLKALFQTIQGILMKALTLDRENQQLMLRRGLMPAEHLPSVAAQKPSFVSSLYQRHGTA
jgi:hypothetical protein